MENETRLKLPSFAERFRQLRGDSSQADFAAFLGISRPTIGFYENGDRLPDALVLKNICEKCKVSSDWLLGLSDVQTADISTQAISKETGLSETAIDVLKFYNGIDPLSEFILTVNFLLEQETPAPHSEYSVPEGLSKEEQERIERLQIAEIEPKFAEWEENDYVQLISRICSYLTVDLSSDKAEERLVGGSLKELLENPGVKADRENLLALNYFKREYLIESLFLIEIQTLLHKAKQKVGRLSE